MCVRAERQNVIPQIMSYYKVCLLVLPNFPSAHCAASRRCPPCQLSQHPLPQFKTFVVRMLWPRSAVASCYGCHRFLTSVEIIISIERKSQLTGTARAVLLSVNSTPFEIFNGLMDNLTQLRIPPHINRDRHGVKCSHFNDVCGYFFQIRLHNFYKFTRRGDCDSGFFFVCGLDATDAQEIEKLSINRRGRIVHIYA